MRSRTTRAAPATASASTSQMSSSWICARSTAQPGAHHPVAAASIASFTTSAALPCNTELTAWRSARVRSPPSDERIAGSGRMRPP